MTDWYIDAALMGRVSELYRRANEMERFVGLRMKTIFKPKKGYPNMPKTWSEPLVDYVLGSQLENKIVFRVNI